MALSVPMVTEVRVETLLLAALFYSLALKQSRRSFILILSRFLDGSKPLVFQPSAAFTCALVRPAPLAVVCKKDSLSIATPEPTPVHLPELSLCIQWFLPLCLY